MNATRFASGLMALGLMTGAQAATVLDEGFGDVAGLTASGWVQTNNSAPAGLPWFQGNSGIFAAQAGPADAYAGVNFLSAAAGVGVIDNWLISPELTLGAGATLSFFTRGTNEGFFDKLEVRFGSGASASVASFTTLLATIGDGISIAYPSGAWQQYMLALPTAATGRVAFRYVASDAGNADYIGIDTVSVMTVAAVPEPGTMALTALGLAALGAVRRRAKPTLHASNV